MTEYVGQKLGNYRLIQRLGEGGFAEVYLGDHVFLGTQAAIKVVTTRLTPEAAQDFLEEARTIARLRHPNIVQVLDFGIEERIPFLVMSYAAHGSLRDKHSKGSRLSEETVLIYTKQVASALQYAHNERLIHRDIKPENMLLGDKDEVLLSDFGIAVVAHGTQSFRTENEAGTVYYMAPEQIQGRPRFASDQYSLGIVVYEWLTGERPFAGTAMEIGMQHLTTPPRSLQELVPSLSPTINQVVLKALAKIPADRFATVQDFANALEDAIHPARRARNRNTTDFSAAPSTLNTRCPNCDARVIAGAVFCSTCGKPIKTATSTSPNSESPKAINTAPDTLSSSRNSDLLQGLKNRAAEPVAEKVKEAANVPPPNPYNVSPPPPPPPNYSQPYSAPPANPYDYPNYQAPPYSAPPPNPYGGYQQQYAYTSNRVMGMSQNVAGGLCYLFSWIAAIIFLIGGRQNHYVRFHSMQSLLYNICLFVAAIPASAASNGSSGLAGLFAILYIIWILLYIVLIICGFSGKYFQIPVIGKIAMSYANKVPR